MNNEGDINAQKAHIRLIMKNKRNGLHTPEDVKAGEQILRHILSMPCMKNPLPESAVIGLYSPIRMEADLLSSFGLLRSKGLRAALPRVAGDRLVFGILENAETLRPGVFGIMEPRPEEEPVLLEDFYMICVPGLAFDRSGGRLGYGKGYYDQFLRCPPGGKRPILIGVGYDFQLFDRLPQEPHDQKLDYIVTPSGVVAAEFSDIV